MNTTETFHGSDIEKIEERFHIPKEQIMQFGANVNPYGLSSLLQEELAKKINCITNYPDPSYRELRTSIGNYCSCPMDHIIVGNGSTELISHMAHFLRPQSALVIAPTYSEYAREIGLSGGQITYFKLEEALSFQIQVDALLDELSKSYDMLILCNPNNPTSTAINQNDLKRVLAFAKDMNTFVVIDETYIEFDPDMDTITAVPLSDSFDNLIILRGISKFFAAPGLRLGYAITSNLSLIAQINEQKNPWSVNSIAEQAGCIMFQDKAYIDQTKALIHKEQRRIYDILSESADYHPYLPHGNFILVKILKEGLTASDLFLRAIKKGMMIRDCSDFMYLDQHYFRFCFLFPEDNDRLLDCLFQS